MKSEGLWVNVKKTKISVTSENAEKTSEEGNFPCAVCRKVGGSNSILCQSNLCQFWVKWSSGLISCGRIGKFPVQIPLDIWLGLETKPRYKASGDLQV